MINCDAYIVEFVGNNWMTIGLGLMFLKGLAQITPWKYDEMIVDLLAGMFSTIRKDAGKK